MGRKTLATAAAAAALAAAFVGTAHGDAELLTDVAGDATRLGPTGRVLPAGIQSGVSEPAVDVLSARAATVEGDLVLTVEVSDLATPPREATFVSSTFSLRHGPTILEATIDHGYDGAGDAAQVTVLPADGEQAFEPFGFHVSGFGDEERDLLTIRVPLARLNHELSAHATGAAPVAPGTVLRDPSVLTMHSVGVPRTGLATTNGTAHDIARGGGHTTYVVGS